MATPSPARESPSRVFIGAVRFVLRQWLRQPAQLAPVVFGMVLATGADVVSPIVSGWLVDAISEGSARAGGLAADSVHRAAWLVGGLGVLGLFGVVGRRFSYLGITHLTVRIMREVAAGAFARVQRFSADWHANTFAGAIVRRITRGMWAIDTFDDTTLLMLLPEIIVLVGSTAVLGWRWPVMGVLLAVSSVAFVAMSVGLTLFYSAPPARLSNSWDTRVGATLADSVTCNAVVKAFGAEAREDARLATVLRRWGRRTVRAWVVGTNSGNLQAAALLALRMVMVGGVVWLWWRGRANAGDVAYVLTMIFLVQGYLRDLGQHISQLQRSVNEMEELVAMFARDHGLADAPGAGAMRLTGGEVCFERVRFIYEAHAQRGAAPLFDDFDLHIPAGQRVGLVGPSGSGKTTLTKLIQRLYDIQSGRILIDGQDVAGVRQESLRSQIALVPQEPILFHRSLAENIAYGRPGASAAEIARAAELANAAGFIERLPKGYQTLVGERGVKLSGGERQRIAIARAFLADCRLLILDEATSSLDTESEALVQEAMQRLMVGRTVIVIAHRLSTVRTLDRILVFQHGRLAEDGSHDALLAIEGGLYRRLHDHQILGEAGGEAEAEAGEVWPA